MDADDDSAAGNRHNASADSADSGAVGNFETAANRIANNRRIASPWTAILTTSDRGDCGVFSVGMVNSNNGTSLRELARLGRYERGLTSGPLTYPIDEREEGTN